FAFVCDKGLNQVRSYILDAAAGTLNTNTTLIIPLASGSGPRHMTFNPQFKRAYVICELNSTIVGFNYNSTNGTLSPFQTNSTLPNGFNVANNTGAEIAVHPSGKFLYSSNRALNGSGFNSIAVFSVNAANGTLALVQQQTNGIVVPRSFAIDPS